MGAALEVDILQGVLANFERHPSRRMKSCARSKP